MSMKIISQKDNTLLHRKEIEADLEFSGATPKKDDVKKMIASQTGSEEARVVIKIMKNDFGSQTASVKAYVYSSEDAMKKIEEFRKKAKKSADGADAKAAPAKK